MKTANPATRPKRNPKLTQNARQRDGYICQCCGGYGDEAHHIHPLVFGGPDELNNLVTLCSPCHKHAPNDPDEFLAYQRSGGFVLADRKRGLMAEYAVERLRQAAEAGKPIPSEEKITAESEAAWLEARVNLFGAPALKALLCLKEVQDNWADHSKAENEERLNTAKQRCQQRIEYFDSFSACDFTENRVWDNINFLLQLPALKKKYGLTEEEHAERERQAQIRAATKSLTELSPHMNIELKQYVNYATCAGSWHELARLCEESVCKNKSRLKRLIPLVMDGSKQAFEDAWKVTCEINNVARKSTAERWVWICASVGFAASHQLDAIDDIGGMDDYLTIHGGSIEEAVHFKSRKVLEKGRRRRKRYGEQLKERRQQTFSRVFDWAKERFGISDYEEAQCEKEEVQLSLLL